jgi:DNA primase
MDRADIVEVVGQFVKLRKRGVNYVANCPFHNEKSPSFSVSSSKGIFKCFGCGKGGNAVTFVQEHEKITYPEAIRWLASFYKIALEETLPSTNEVQHLQTEESLRVLNEFACKYFETQLMHTDEGKAIGMSYFKERGFHQNTIEQFRLGYCPESGQAFYQAAHEKGFDDTLLEKAGLVKINNGRPYDVYRGRVIFPIQSMTGRILGFGARILKASEKAPKYINTPENELYHKSKVLYGIYHTRNAINKQDECLLVEGYTDVISLSQAGVANVVSSSGTALTEDQLRIISRVTKHLTILYDGDSAGIKAAIRGTDMAIQQRFNVKLALLPEGNDPDSFIQKSGATAFNAYIQENKKDIIGFRIETGILEVAGDPALKSKLVNEIAQSISFINKTEDFTLHEHYIQQASTQLKVDEAALIQLVNKYVRDRIEDQKKSTASANTTDTYQTPPSELEVPNVDEFQQSNSADLKQEWQLIRILILHGNKSIEGYSNVAAHVFERIDPEMIENPQVRYLYDLYFKAGDAALQPQYFTNHSDPKVSNTIANLLYEKDEVSSNWLDKYGIDMIHGSDPYLTDIESSMTYFELKKIKWMQLEVQNNLAKAIDMNQQIQFLQQIVALKKTEKEILQRIGTVIIKSGK